MYIVGKLNLAHHSILAFFQIANITSPMPRPIPQSFCHPLLFPRLPS